jgi:cytochrome c biogenesis protein ResB
MLSEGQKHTFSDSTNPFYLELEAFHQTHHPGTTIPKSFSSKVSLYDEAGKLDRTVTIAMNSPLHYRGKSFYQSSFDNMGKASILHVVENRWKALPYLSLGVIASGLVLHLINLFRRRQ